MSSLADIVNRTFTPPKPVSIVEFAESSDFCGRELYPHQRVLLKLIHLEELDGWEEDILTDWINGGYRGEVEISPMIRERVAFLREMGYDHFREIYLVGGRRSGKGFMTAIATCKKLYEAQRLGDPATHYGIARNKEIYFTCVAASLEQAQKFQFSDIRDIASSCKALAPFIPALNEESFTIATDADKYLIAELKRQGIKVNANFASLRVKPLAAQAGTIRGSASLVLIFDEMAHMIGVEGKSSAEEVYKAAVPATRSFGPAAMIFANSSPYTQVGQFYELVKAANQLEHDSETDSQLPKYPNLLAMRFPSWEMFRDYEKDPRKRFNARGAIIVSPDWPDEKLTNPQDKAKKYQEKLDELKDPDAYRVEARAQWATIIDAFLDPDKVERAFDPFFEYPDGFKPVTEQQHGTFLYKYIGHADPASTSDGFGMAIAHVEEYPSVLRKGETDKHVIFDVVHRWEPKEFPEHTIDYERVQDDILEYIKVFFPQQFTFDQFNGAALSQWLMREVRSRGLNTQVNLMHHTQKQNWQMWNDFRTALNLNLVHVPHDCRHSDWAKTELKFLERKNNRVDHQTTGPCTTSDMATCIGYVTHKLLGQYIQNWSALALGEAQPAFGAMGGYRIGGNTPDNINPKATVDNLKSIYARKYMSNSPARGTRPR